MKAVLILIIIVVYSSLQEDDCCFKKTVAGTDTLDGPYIFLRKFDPPSSKVAECVDACIYSRNVPGHEGEEYCFTPTLDGAAINDQCEAPPTQSPPPTTTTTLATTTQTTSPTTPTTSAPTSTPPPLTPAPSPSSKQGK